MANSFKLVFIIAGKFSPVSPSKRVACVISIPAIANIDCKYMKFCARDIYGSYMLAPRDFLLEPIQKKQLIQSQVGRIKLFTLEFQFLFDTRNDENYLTLKGTIMRIEKLNRRYHVNLLNASVAFT